MALRIGGGPKALPPMEDEMPMQEEMMGEVAPDDLMSELPESLDDERMQGMEVDPAAVHYMDGVERASKTCGGCKHFLQEGACHIVAGPIDPEGVCNLFASATPEMGEEIPMEEPLPEEAPIEEELPVEGE